MYIKHFAKEKPVDFQIIVGTEPVAEAPEARREHAAKPTVVIPPPSSGDKTKAPCPVPKQHSKDPVTVLRNRESVFSSPRVETPLTAPAFGGAPTPESVLGPWSAPALAAPSLWDDMYRPRRAVTPKSSWSGMPWMPHQEIPKRSSACMMECTADQLHAMIIGGQWDDVKAALPTASCDLASLCQRLAQPQLLPTLRVLHDLFEELAITTEMDLAAAQAELPSVMSRRDTDEHAAQHEEEQVKAELAAKETLIQELKKDLSRVNGEFVALRTEYEAKHQNTQSLRGVGGESHKRALASQWLLHASEELDKDAERVEETLKAWKALETRPVNSLSTQEVLVLLEVAGFGHCGSVCVLNAVDGPALLRAVKAKRKQLPEELTRLGLDSLGQLRQLHFYFAHDCVVTQHDAFASPVAAWRARDVSLWLRETLFVHPPTVEMLFRANFVTGQSLLMLQAQDLYLLGLSKMDRQKIMDGLPHLQK